MLTDVGVLFSCCWRAWRSELPVSVLLELNARLSPRNVSKLSSHGLFLCQPEHDGVCRVLVRSCEEPSGLPIESDRTMVWSMHKLLQGVEYPPHEVLIQKGVACSSVI